MPNDQASLSTSPGVFFSVTTGATLDDENDNQTYRARLRTILSEEQGTSKTLQSILALGAEWLGVEHGHLVQIDPAEGTHTIVEEGGPHPEIEEGETAALSTTYCRTVLAEGKALAIENAPEQGWAEDPAYEKFGFSTYLGAKVVVGGDLYGTVRFVDREPREKSFVDSDAVALSLIVQAVEQELERRRRENRVRPIPARLEALFTGSPDMTHLHDPEGNILLPNPRLCKKTGYDEETLVQMKVWELAPMMDPGAFWDLWQNMEPGDRRRFMTQYRCEDGSTIPVEVTLRHLDLEGEDWFVATARDVTVREKQRRELRREKERFESLVQEVEEYAIFMLGPEGHVQSWNEGAERIKGYSKLEIIDEPLSTFYTEEDCAAGRPAKNLRRAKRQGSVQEEGWRVRKDGSRFWANVTITALRTENGDLRGFTKVTRDMTDRKKRERRYEAIFNQTYQLIGLLERDGTLIEVNETALRFAGLDREDVVGKPFWETYWWQVDEDTKRKLREAIERAAEGEFVRYEVELQGKVKNIVVDFSIRPIRNKRGEVTLLIPEGRNITELKALRRREQQLERARNLLAQAQRLADVGGWKLDVRGDPPYTPEWTDELYDLFELPHDAELTVEEVLEFYPPDAREERAAAIERALELGEGWDLESRMTTAQGNERWIRSIGEAIMGGGEVVALHGAFQDITARKEREEQLERQNQRLDQFASLVSHDLRGPLNVLKGRLALAQEEDNPSHLAAAERAIDRMDGIIEDLLTLTWGGQDLDPEEMEIHSLTGLAQASWDYVDTADATLDLEDDLHLRAHEGRLRRFLENLFRNAVEHGGQAVAVRVGALDDGFYVEDDGSGIPEDKREKVLEGGYSSREEGTGLGLSIAQAIVETHGWTLTVAESDEGGARFEVRGADLEKEREVEAR